MLDKQSLLSAVQILITKDSSLREIIEKHGPPPLWSRDPDFSTLVKIILEQQVSLASAQAAFMKLKSLVGHLTPKSLNALTDKELRKIGFSRQKTRYCRILAEAILTDELDLVEIQKESDSKVIEILTNLKGIGSWTASIYLLMALKRPDIWPKEDRALLVAIKETKNLENVPTPKESMMMAEAWKPWRSVAARILWHSYLSEKKKVRVDNKKHVD